MLGNGQQNLIIMCKEETAIIIWDIIMASGEHACINVHTHVAGLFIMYMHNNIMLVGKKEPLLILVISDSITIGLNITPQFC